MDTATPEDEARAILARMGVEGDFSAGDLVELANLIAEVRQLRRVAGAVVVPGCTAATAVIVDKAGGPTELQRCSLPSGHLGDHESRDAVWPP